MSTNNYPVFGMIFGRGGRAGIGPASSGMLLAERTADNSVEREKYTQDATASGALEWHYVRTTDIHTSISTLISSNTGPSETITERKVFASGWLIFNSEGEAVGATTGTTSTDVTPSGLGTG